VLVSFTAELIGQRQFLKSVVLCKAQSAENFPEWAWGMPVWS
jgi:hypothetical protein